MAGTGGRPDLSTPSGVMDYVEFITRAPAKVQQDLLLSILQENARCEYLTRQGLNGRTDVESFKACVPLSSFESIKHDIARIANGESSEEGILSAGRITHFIASSGTSSGEQKLFPKVESESLLKVGLFSIIAGTVAELAFPALAHGKGLYFLVMRPGTPTTGGLMAYAATAFLLTAAAARDPAGAKMASPWPVLLAPEKDDQMLYCHWLCGLVRYQEVVRIGGLFASQFVRVVRFLQTAWPQVCRDIRQGRVDGRVEDPEVRRVVEAVMGGPNEEVADRVESVCSHRSNWDHGILPALFPNAAMVETIVTGSMAAYLPLVRSYAGEVPIVSLAYASSEAFLGVNLRPTCAPEDIAYTLIPSFAYYEFLPVSQSQSQSSEEEEGEDEASQLVDLADVKLGQVYELVLTTAGLYRYRMEDCLRVARFYNATPEFQFVERRNVVLSVDTDKTTESELLGAVAAAAAVLTEEAAIQARVFDFSSYADVSSAPGHYVVFLELTEELPPDETSTVLGPVMEKCAARMESAFSSVYARNRREARVGPLELRVVEKGSFDLIKDAAVARGASENQFKTPRCLKAPSPLLDILNGRTVKVVRSASASAL